MSVTLSGVWWMLECVLIGHVTLSVPPFRTSKSVRTRPLGRLLRRAHGVSPLYSEWMCVCVEGVC